MGFISKVGSIALHMTLALTSIFGFMSNIATASPDPRTEKQNPQSWGTKVSGGGGAYENRLMDFEGAKLGFTNIPFDPQSYVSRNGQKPYEWIVKNIYDVELLNYPSVVSALEKVFSAKAWYFVNATEIKQAEAIKLKNSLQQEVAFILDETKLKIVGFQTKKSVVICKPWFDQKIESAVNSEEWLHGVGLLTHEAWINLTMELGLSDLVAGELNVMLFARHLGGSFPSRKLGLYLKNAGLCPIGEQILRASLASLRQTLLEISNSIASNYYAPRFYKANKDDPKSPVLPLDRQEFLYLSEIPPYRFELVKAGQVKDFKPYLYSPVLRKYINEWEKILNSLRPSYYGASADAPPGQGVSYPATFVSATEAILELRNLIEYLEFAKPIPKDCEFYW